MTGQTGPPLRPASSVTRIVRQRLRVVPGEGSGLAFRRKRSRRPPQTARPPEGRAPLGQVSERACSPAGDGLPLLPPSHLISPSPSPGGPPASLTGHLPSSSPLRPPPLPGAPRGPPRRLPIPLSSRLPAQPYLLAFSSVAPYQMPSLHLRPLICWVPRPHTLLFFPLLDGDPG